MARDEACSPWSMSCARSLVKSQARSLLSIAKSKRAREDKGGQQEQYSLTDQMQSFGTGSFRPKVEVQDVQNYGRLLARNSHLISHALRIRAAGVAPQSLAGRVNLIF